MIKGKIKQELTMDAILGKISPYDIYVQFMPTKGWKLNEVTHSPFSQDKNPSFLIGNKYGNLSHIAFNDTSKRGDCFAFVKQLHSLANLDEVLKKIDTEFQLGLSGGVQGDYKAIISQYKQPEITKRNSLIQVITRKFTLEELAYWNQYDINLQELRENNVYSIKTMYFNKSRFPLKETELRFGYFYDGFWKLYRPFQTKKNKWLSNVPITVMDKKEAIKDCNIAFLTKSKKDGIILRKLYKCVASTQNEGIACFSEENVDYIKTNSKRQVLLYDSDIPGVEASQQITKLFDFDYCNVPRKYLPEGIKDFSDLAKIHGMKAVEEVLKEKKLI